MAKVPSDKEMKSLVVRVKEFCSGLDDVSIHILLQQNDYNADQTVQAFLDGTANEMLDGWEGLNGNNTSKSNASKKKRKNKNKNNENGDPAPIPPPLPPSIYNGSVLNGDAHMEWNEMEAATSEDKKQTIEPKIKVPATRPKEDYRQQQTKKARDRTLSEASASSTTIDKKQQMKTPHAGLEKSFKDLQRQTVSLQRLKVVLNEQVDKSFKRITEVFKELHNQLNEREAEILFEMDKAKNLANSVLDEQQQKAIELKHKTDRAQSMKEHDIAELRSQIKLFVGERKHYEDLSNAQRFVCDFNHMLEEFRKFGEVVPVKAVSDARRPSIVSVDSSIASHEEISSIVIRSTSSTAVMTTPTPPTDLLSIAKSKPSLINQPKSVPIVTSTANVSNSTHVLMQSDSLTKYEATEMAQRLNNLSLNNDSKESSSTSLPVKSSRSDRGRGSRGGTGNSRGGGRGGGRRNSGEPQQPTSPRGEQGRGRGRGGRGQGQGQGSSNRGQGSTKNDESVVEKTNITESSSLSSSPHKNPPNESPRGQRRGRGGGGGGGGGSGRRPDNRQRQSDDSPSSSSADKQQPNNNSSSSAQTIDQKKSIISSSSREKEDESSLKTTITNHVDALPQRGNRNDRNRHGDSSSKLQSADGRKPTPAEPVLMINGEAD